MEEKGLLPEGAEIKGNWKKVPHSLLERTTKPEILIKRSHYSHQELKLIGEALASFAEKSDEIARVMLCEHNCLSQMEAAKASRNLAAEFHDQATSWFSYEVDKFNAPDREAMVGAIAENVENWDLNTLIDHVKSQEEEAASQLSDDELYQRYKDVADAE